RADLSSLLGPVDAFDAAATGRFAQGKRVSGWLSLDHARSQVERFGPGLVSYTVDVDKTVAMPADAASDPERYWSQARPLSAWLADGNVPDDLDVHQPVPVRAKHLQLHAPLVTDDQLAEYAPLVAAVADGDRLAAKAVMHLAIVAADGDLESPEFATACALAWRDEPDRSGLFRELVDLGPDTVASAALATHGSGAPDAAAHLRSVLEETRDWAADEGLEPGPGLLERSAALLDQIERAR
ncbi:MAG: hypothetical protein WD011_03665, partial [Nitriliruptoraceae bacterium]